MNTLTGKLTAYLTGSYFDEDALDESKPPEKRIEAIHFSNRDMRGCGWTVIGVAEITVTLNNRDELINAKVDSLKAQKKQLEADHQVALNAITEKINNLLALPYQPEIDQA